jgi:hypothetical protein
MMQWNSIINTGHAHAWALKNGTTVAELKFSMESKTMRLYASDIRQFFLENTGKFHQRVIMTSGYGILLGELQSFRQSQNGVLYLNQYKYYYREDQQGITLMDQGKRSIAACGIATVSDLNLFEFASLIFGFVWVWQSMEMLKPTVIIDRYF